MKSNFGAAAHSSIVIVINTMTVLLLLLIKWIEVEKIRKNLKCRDEINNVERARKNYSPIIHNVICKRLLLFVLAAILFVGTLLPALQQEPVQQAYAQSYRNI